MINAQAQAVEIRRTQTSLNIFEAVVSAVAAAIYALLFKEGGNSAPPFPHFDKVGHFGLFFGQAWLCAKIFIQDNRTIPYKGILFAALLFAIGSELAQAFLTATRQGSIADGIADMAGTAAALWFAEKIKAAKS